MILYQVNKNWLIKVVYSFVLSDDARNVRDVLTGIFEEHWQGHLFSLFTSFFQHIMIFVWGCFYMYNLLEKSLSMGL